MDVELEQSDKMYPMILSSTPGGTAGGAFITITSLQSLTDTKTSRPGSEHYSEGTTVNVGYTDFNLI